MLNGDLWNPEMQGVVACRVEIESIGSFRICVWDINRVSGFNAASESGGEDPSPHFISRTCSWPSSMIHTQRSRKS